MRFNLSDNIIYSIYKFKMSSRDRMVEMPEVFTKPISYKVLKNIGTELINFHQEKVDMKDLKLPRDVELKLELLESCGILLVNQNYQERKKLLSDYIKSEKQQLDNEVKYRSTISSWALTGATSGSTLLTSILAASQHPFLQSPVYYFLAVLFAGIAAGSRYFMNHSFA